MFSPTLIVPRVVLGVLPRPSPRDPRPPQHGHDQCRDPCWLHACGLWLLACRQTGLCSLCALPHRLCIQSKAAYCRRCVGLRVYSLHSPAEGSQPQCLESLYLRYGTHLGLEPTHLQSEAGRGLVCCLATRDGGSSQLRVPELTHGSHILHLRRITQKTNVSRSLPSYGHQLGHQLCYRGQAVGTRLSSQVRKSKQGMVKIR